VAAFVAYGLTRLYARWTFDKYLAKPPASASAPTTVDDKIAQKILELFRKEFHPMLSEPQAKNTVPPSIKRPCDELEARGREIVERLEAKDTFLSHIGNIYEVHNRLEDKDRPSSIDPMYGVLTRNRKAEGGWQGAALPGPYCPELPSCFSAPIICASVPLIFDIPLPLSFVRNHTRTYSEIGEQV
jgi:hypothetical protein